LYLGESFNWVTRQEHRILFETPFGEMKSNGSGSFTNDIENYYFITEKFLSANLANIQNVSYMSMCRKLLVLTPSQINL